LQESAGRHRYDRERDRSPGAVEPIPTRLVAINLTVSGTPVIRLRVRDGRPVVRGDEESAVVAAALAGEEPAFADLVERHRRELQLHCYRMLGSYHDSEDMVQETFLRAWRRRATFEGRSTFRAWLYRIATNACLDALTRRRRRMLPYDVVPAAVLDHPLPEPQAEFAWLEPYPDHLLDAAQDPAGEVVARETVEIAFLAAIQHLPPRQRAVLILRDVLGWSAPETAETLEMSATAVKSALQRARSTMRTRLPDQRGEWAGSAQRGDDEQALLQRYMAAIESEDEHAVAELLREDLRASWPPRPLWTDSRESFVAGTRKHAAVGDYRAVPIRANRQPAVAVYLRRPGDTGYRPLVLEVLRWKGGKVAEIIDFTDLALFPAFGLPDSLTG
jgi:RNA polymerase sigma-70 factor, ECF subfamily